MSNDEQKRRKLLSWRRQARSLSTDERIRIRRSRVRTMVTHGAAWFLFAGGAALITYLVIWGGDDGDDKGIDLFLTILPVAASIVSFWFAGRTQRDRDSSGDRTETKSERPQ